MASSGVTNPLLGNGTNNGQQVQSYGVGNPSYGGGRPSPNVGPVSAQGNLGYAQRDNKATGMRQALLRRMKANKAGRFASSAAQTPSKNLFPGPGGF